MRKTIVNGIRRTGFWYLVISELIFTLFVVVPIVASIEGYKKLRRRVTDA